MKRCPAAAQDSLTGLTPLALERWVGFPFVIFHMEGDASIRQQDAATKIDETGPTSNRKLALYYADGKPAQPLPRQRY